MKKYRLRPSVSFLVRNDSSEVEFFLSNTRESKRIVIQDPGYIDVLRNLNGTRSIGELSDDSHLSERVKAHLSEFLSVLEELCIAEDSSVASLVEQDQSRRLLSFLGDYIPSFSILNSMEKLRNSCVVIIGLGGIGSWVCALLAQMQVERFVLVDQDTVETSNLNRSLFGLDDVGKYKTTACSRLIRCYCPNATIVSTEEVISSVDDVRKVIADESGQLPDLVINCADYPNVDTTSGWVSDACMPLGISHILAGGYNLHLSLVGPTIVPGEGPCFRCIEQALNTHNSETLGLRKLHRSHRDVGSVAPLAGISASFVANEAIRTLLRREGFGPVMIGKRGEFNFLTRRLHQTVFETHPACRWHRLSGVEPY